MGARYWEAVTPYEEVVERALRQAQIHFFREAGYDVPQRLAERVESMTRAVHACEQDDPYGLLDFYRDALDQYRQMAANEVPEDPGTQIDLLRRIEEVSGNWVGNILDMKGLCQGYEEGKVRRLTAERIEEAFGTASPSLHEVREGMGGLAGSISRGTAVCFPVYEDGRPVAWFFAGYSAD